MLKIMLNYRPNGRSRLGGTLKSLADGAEISLLRPNSWRLVVVVVMMISSTISDCTEILPGLSDNSMFHVYTRGHHLINLTVTAKWLYKILTNVSTYKLPGYLYTCWMQLVLGFSQFLHLPSYTRHIMEWFHEEKLIFWGGHCDKCLYENVSNHEWLPR